MANTHAIDLESASSQYLSRADEAAVSLTGDITIELWVQIESLPSDGNSVDFVSKERGSAGNRGWRTGINNASGVYGLFITTSSDGTAVLNDKVTWSPSLGVYYHIAFVYTASAGTCDVYVNGAQQGSQITGLATSIFDNSIALTVGASFDSAGTAVSFFDGLIDDIRLWSATRTVAQILANYRGQIDSTSGLVGSWHLNNALTDSSGNALTLTNNGTAVFSTQPPFFENSDTLGVATESVVFSHDITITDTAGAPTESVSFKSGWANLVKNTTIWTNLPKN